MRRLLVLVTSLIILVFGMSTVAMAYEDTNNNGVVLFQKDEIKDPAMLLERAKKGITDYNGFVADWAGSDDLKVDKVVTTQKLKAVKDSKEKVTTSYVTTGIYNIQTTGYGSKGLPVWDGSGGVQAYLNIYWEIISDPYNVSYNRIYQTSVTFTRYDSSISIKPSSTYVKSAEEGGSYNPSTGTYGTTSKSCSRAYPGATFGYSYNCDPRYYASDWPWPYVTFSCGRVVGSADTVLKRGTTEWRFSPVISEGQYP